ncbi:unnamed protein product, partial [Amoebophrya sp. A25]
ARRTPNPSPSSKSSKKKRKGQHNEAAAVSSSAQPAGSRPSENVAGASAASDRDGTATVADE